MKIDYADIVLLNAELKRKDTPDTMYLIKMKIQDV